MPEKPRRSASRATSKVSCRRPGTATRLRAGNASDIQARSKRFTTRIEISQRLPRRSSRERSDLAPGDGRDPFVDKLVTGSMNPGLRRDLRMRPASRTRYRRGRQAAAKIGKTVAQREEVQTRHVAAGLQPLASPRLSTSFWGSCCSYAAAKPI